MVGETMIGRRYLSLGIRREIHYCGHMLGVHSCASVSPHSVVIPCRPMMLGISITLWTGKGSKTRE